MGVSVEMELKVGDKDTHLYQSLDRFLFAIFSAKTWPLGSHIHPCQVQS